MADTGQVETAGLQRARQSAAGIDDGAAGNTVVAKAVAMATTMRERVMALPAGKRNGLFVSLAFLAAVLAGMIWYAGRTDWRVLFSGLDGKDMQQVSQELAAANIPFEMTADGASVQVPTEMLDKARMEIAAKGMPQTGRLGFELFDKPNWVGSEFDEKVNYQRALEGELEHTIGSLGMVKSARVHLVLPQPSLFSAEEKVAKASVVLKLKRASMDTEQADSIRSLVAGAVDNLSPDQVTLVDADGRANFKPKSKDVNEADVEQAMEAKLVAMLEPLAGRDNVRATINVNYDQGSEDRTDEVYDPDHTATLTLQKSEQVSESKGRAMGVPGTASNSPVGAAVGSVAGSQAAASPNTPPLLQKEALPVYPQGAGVGQSLHQENGTYGVTKHLLHTEEGPGRVRRLTAAVVVNDRSVMEGVGKQEHLVWKPRSTDEMRRLEDLAKAAVGFDAKRGDQVAMENVSFSSNSPEVKPPVMERFLEEVQSLLHSQPGLAKTAMVGLCGVLLVLFVVRPMAKQVTATLREPLLLTTDTSTGTQEMFALQSNEHEEISHVPISLKKSRAQLEAQGIFEHVSEHIRREPAQSTRLLEAWIGSPDEVQG